MTNEVEQYKLIPGTTKFYVSNFGNVISKDERWHKYEYKTLKTWLNNCGYIYVSIEKNGKRIVTPVHRLVAECFCKNHYKLKTIDQLDVNHKDENKQNNNSKNLEWITYKMNCRKRSKNAMLRKQKIKN